MNGFARRLAVVLVVALASGHRSDAFCGLRSADGVDGDDLVACLKAKAIAALDRVSRADALPLTGSVTLVRDYDDAAARHRGQRSDEPPVTEQELRSRPDHALDRMLYYKAVGFFDGRSVRISFPELAADQLRTTLEEGNRVMALGWTRIGLVFDGSYYNMTVVFRHTLFRITCTPKPTH